MSSPPPSQGLRRGEGPQDGESLAVAQTDESEMRALLADHNRRLDALEADRGALEREGERVNGAAD
jgi:hypothetical protein